MCQNLQANQYKPVQSSSAQPLTLQLLLAVSISNVIVAAYKTIQLNQPTSSQWWPFT